MNIRHIQGMMLRNIIVWMRDIDRIFDAFWWAFFDLVIWGFMSTYIGKMTEGNMIQQLLTGIILWSVLARSQWEMSAAMLLESWEKNLINIFTSPLTIAEFIASSILLGVIKLIMVFLFMAALTALFYHFNVFVLNWWILVLLLNVFMTSIWIALFVNSMILRWGKRVVSFAWTLALVVNPLSGVMYPIKALPAALQYISWCLPTSYVFEGMRSLLTTNTVDIRYVGMSVGLNIIYVVIATAVYYYTFKKAREHGWLIKLA